MKGKKGKKQLNINVRFDFLTILTYVIGAILLLTLFKLQVIDGLTYRERSNARLVKEVDVEPVRGSIMDRTGSKYASTEISYSLELLKNKLDNKEINEMGNSLLEILERRGQSYNQTFPIDVNTMQFRFLNEEGILKWKQDNKLPATASAKEVYELLKEKYKIEQTDINSIRRILEIRDLYNFGKTTNNLLKISEEINRDTVLEIEEKAYKLNGINITENTKRVYPKENELSHVLGYVSRINSEEYKNRKNDGYNQNDKIGQTGIEKTFEKLLKGSRGKKVIEQDVNGVITNETVIKDPTGGSNVVLTIDSKLQKVTEDSLERTILKMRNGGFGKVYDSKGGSAVVMNVKTGEVLAMASYPDYNPSDFVNGISAEKWRSYNTNLSELLNRSIQSTYAPASTFKMVTAIAALNENVTTSVELINDTGEYPRAHRPVCWIFGLYGTGHGRLNIVGALKNSCNYFFYEVGGRLGIDRLAKYARYFGLGVKTGIEIVGEAEGMVASHEAAAKQKQTFTEGGLLSASIGQSYNSFTPLQMAKYISILANGGNYVRPTIIKSINNSNGTRLSKEEVNKVVEELTGYTDNNIEKIDINKEHIDTVLEGMRSVTGDRGGTAYSVFKDFNIEVGGKTGSAEAGYYTNGLFAGFAPFHNPEIAIITIIENGTVGFHTAEVVRDIMIEYFGMNVTHIKEDMSVQKEGEYII